MNNRMSTDNKSKKRKDSIINKTNLWNIFDSEVINEQKLNVPLECMYGSSGREMCERCESILAFSDEGFLTCTNNKCGIIYKDLVDQTPEWRYYGADDNQNNDPTRCGMPINPLLEESSYGCKVLCIGHMSYEMRKIRRYNEWQSMPYKEKSQYDEFQIITIMAQNAGMPKMIIDDAIRYHKKISEYELTFRGDNRDGILAASIYISCRVNNFPRTAKEIANIFHLDITSATKGCKNALSIINNIEKDMDNKEKTNFGRTKPEAFIERFCSKLNINNELTKLCQFISMKIEKNNIMPENTPHSIAAGVVYFISQNCGLNINKRDVKSVSEISEVTINKCFKKLDKIKTELIPTVILKKYAIV
uniref:Transcription factor TFIIB cyclin-like domain-containing protein n=1 Tax=viral metagenome TaxID=1070528 RepID=A0A6C0EVY4_9ZZZZ